jgi:hypothetical protein
MNTFDKLTSSLIDERRGLIGAGVTEPTPAPAPAGAPGFNDSSALSKFFDTPEDDKKHADLLSKQVGGYLGERLAAAWRSDFCAAFERTTKDRGTSALQARVNAAARAARHASAIGPVSAHIRGYVINIASDIGAP